jgi:hypothetical protein
MLITSRDFFITFVLIFLAPIPAIRYIPEEKSGDAATIWGEP